jgi:urea carboxylase
MREDFPRGRFKLKVEEQTFRLSDYRKFLDEKSDSIAAFRQKQRQAFSEERHRWEVSGQLNFSAENEAAGVATERAALPEGHSAVPAHVPGNVWKITAKVGQRVTRNEPLVILESMKMEISVFSSAAGEVVEIACAEGKPVQAGEPLVVIKTDA